MKRYIEIDLPTDDIWNYKVNAYLYYGDDTIRCDEGLKPIEAIPVEYIREKANELDRWIQMRMGETAHSNGATEYRNLVRDWRLDNR